MINRGDKDFAVADLPGLGRVANGLDDPLGLGIIDHELDSDLRQQINRVFGAAIDLRVALLAAVAFGFDNRNALQADAPECFAHVVELEWLDDGNDQLHRPRLVGRPERPRYAALFPTRATEDSMRAPML